METVPERYWYNIGNALQIHGFVYGNLDNWPKGFTPEKIAAMAELMIFEPKMEIGFKDYDEATGRFTLVREL